MNTHSNLIKARVYIDPEVHNPFIEDEDPYMNIKIPAVPREGDSLELGEKLKTQFIKKFKNCDRNYIGWYWKYFYCHTAMEIEKAQNLNQNYNFTDKSFDDFSLDAAHIIKQITFHADKDYITIHIGKTYSDRS